MKSSLFLLPLLLLLSFSCTKKNENTGPQLPPITQTGAGTFGCKVNGRIYLPSGNGWINFGGPNPTFSVSYMGSKLELWISANKNNNPREEFTISVPYDRSIGVYQTEDMYPYGASFRGFAGSVDTAAYYRTDSTHILYVTVSNNFTTIISGTFEGEMIGKDGVVVQITEGRFDLRDK